MEILVRRIAVLVVVGFVLVAAGSIHGTGRQARAQSSLQVALTGPMVQAFPRIGAYLDVHTTGGAFVHGLPLEAVQVIENGQSLPAAVLRETRPGVQFVAVINPGPSFSIRDSQGTSRYDRVAGVLQDWVRSRLGSTIDDLSLLAAGSIQVTHTASGPEMLKPLEGYEFNREENPSLDILDSALDIAGDPPARPGMERAVLLITAPPQGDFSFVRQNITALAVQQKVRIFVWLVASPDVISAPVANELQQLALGTGGQYFAFSGTEELPRLETYLEPLRSIYWLEYDSRINAGGNHQVAVVVDHSGQSATTEAQSFQFDLRPPDPAFISPPAEILRQPPAQAGPAARDGIDPSELDPPAYTLQVFIHFPDGHPRPVVQARLYVDGVLAIENTSQPFDLFTWDLSAYAQTGQHSLQVEVVDSLGLTGRSIQVPVQVRVERPQSNPLSSLVVNWPILAGLAAVVGAAILLLFLILGGWIGPHAGRLKRAGRRRPEPAVQAAPEIAESASRQLPGWVNRLHWPQRRLSPNAYAFLTRLNEVDDTRTQLPIPITASELTFGRDANLATLMVDDLSVDGLHARMIRSESGDFLLADEGSVAGTWINYVPVPRQGAPLEHGDILHIGRVGFRFSQREPQRVRRPVVIVKEVKA